MQPSPQTVALAPPRGFNYSLDWRFLLPMTELSKGCFLFEENVDFSQTLEQVGIHTSQQLSFSDLKNPNHRSFPFLAMPLGLPVNWVRDRNADRVKFYSALRRFIDPGSSLLVGFNNRLSWHARKTKYYASQPQRISNELIQAGFKSVEIFGAMPDLQIPEYIFELDSRTLRFALHNRFRRKPAILKVLRVLSGTIGWKRLTHFLPCYFAVAAA